MARPFLVEVIGDDVIAAALRLYERAGMHVARRSDTYERRNA